MIAGQEPAEAAPTDRPRGDDSERRPLTVRCAGSG